MAEKTKDTKKASTTSKKSTTNKKAATNRKKTTSKKTAISKKNTTNKKPIFQSEYYDLPYMYNKTVVRVLAQTPKMLFIYWEVSEKDITNFKKNYGENFLEVTYPVLVVYNDTLHYSFEVTINDFANSWYLHISDANCEYHVEIGRRPIMKETSTGQSYAPSYIYVNSSNEMNVPNNKIMFDIALKNLKFRNIKTGQVFDKNINEFTFITNFGIFNIKDLYKELYSNENFEYEDVFIGNPSSAASSMFIPQ